MKLLLNTKFIAATLIMLTAALVFFYPAYQLNIANARTNSPAVPLVTENTPSIEVVFVLDTTGSMSGLIQAAKEKIWSIASSMGSAQQTPNIKIGLVAYRDRKESYITKIIDLSNDLDTMYAQLMDFKAAGGGDGPESVNQALYDAVHKMSWSQSDTVYKAVFLVGDAPPHMDYQDDVKYPVTLKVAASKGIVVNTIQCGSNRNTTPKWQHIASLSQGQYFQVAQAGNAVAIATPYDKKLAVLAKKIDKTRLFFGNESDKKAQLRKDSATKKMYSRSSDASQARRAEFNVTPSGKANFVGEKELVDAIASGRIELDSVKKSELPAVMQPMSSVEQQKHISGLAEERKVIKQQIQALADSRQIYIQDKLKKSKHDVSSSLDEKLYKTIRKQAGKKGLDYSSKLERY